MVSVKHMLCVWYTEDAPKTIVIIITIIIIVCLHYALHVIYQKKSLLNQ